jgi:pyruvate formate lyase activating enzyme
MTGRIHSIETAGMVDGPGIRYTVFLSGCPLRCLYCHNSDTWDYAAGQDMTVDELLADMEKYRTYMRSSGGGVTFTGGEPFGQAEFLLEILRVCRERGIHTAVDTSGYHTNEQRGVVREILAHADMLLLDIKSANAEKHLSITGKPIEPTLEVLRLTSEMKLPVWIRHVVVPGLTDGENELAELGRLVSGYDNIEKIELLPFSKIGEHKWENVREKYTLTDTPPPSEADMARYRKIMENA